MNVKEHKKWPTANLAVDFKVTRKNVYLRGDIQKEVEI